MATKTKASTGTVHEHAELQKALKAIGEAQEALGAGFALSARAECYLLEAQAALSEAASHLRDLLKGKGDRCSPRPGSRTLPDGRKMVYDPLSPLPRSSAPKRSAVARKRLARKQAIEDLQNNSDLPF